MNKFLTGLAAVFVMVMGMLHTAEAADVFPKFSSQTLDGQPVSSAVFAENRLTVINFWGTYCPPCIEEMPDLGELARSMPEGTRLVGIIIDAAPDDDDVKGEARDILTEAKAEFLQILPVRDMIPYMETLVGVPTTIFVDSDGKVVGEPLIGSRSGQEYRTEIEKALKLLKGK